MNKDNYTMDFEERRQYAYDKAYEILEGDDDAFVEACNALNSYSGFLGEDECISMWEIDEFFNKPSELLDVMDEFNPTDEYFYFHNGYLESCDDAYEHYSDIYGVDEVLDALIENYNHVYLTANSRLDEIVNVLFNEDFGIEDGWEYDENNWEDDYYNDTPEETDKEFMKYIDNI